MTREATVASHGLQPNVAISAHRMNGRYAYRGACGVHPARCSARTSLDRGRQEGRSAGSRESSRRHRAAAEGTSRARSINSLRKPEERARARAAAVSTRETPPGHRSPGCATRPPPPKLANRAPHRPFSSRHRPKPAVPFQIFGFRKRGAKFFPDLEV